MTVAENDYHAALATWSGKTPLTLLNEHCQRNQWERPQVNAVRSGLSPSPSQRPS